MKYKGDLLMFTTHTSKTLPGCLMLVGVLVVTAPALAMNDPVTGRWLTRDPIGYVDGANVYQYVRSNPVSRVDPFGLACCQFPDGSSTNDLTDQGGSCDQDPDSEDPMDFENDCATLGGTYSQCDCVPNSQGCPLDAPGNTVGDGYCEESYNPFHMSPGGDADSCYRGLGTNAGQQCCYSDDDCLIGDGSSGAGSWDRSPPSSTEDASGDCNFDGQIVGHFVNDMTPIGDFLRKHPYYLPGVFPIGGIRPLP